MVIRGGRCKENEKGITTNPNDRTQMLQRKKWTWNYGASSQQLSKLKDFKETKRLIVCARRI